MAGLFDFTHAIARVPGRSVVHGLRDGAGADPDFEALTGEHLAYVSALQNAGVKVELLPAEEDFPDSVFVEDAALVFGAGAILLRPGARSRAAEAELIAPVLKRRFDTVLVLGEGHADGGDVLVTPHGVVIGLSHRTDKAGAEALGKLLLQLGRKPLIASTPAGILHFKTGCGMIDEETVLVAPAMVDCLAFSGLRVLVTPAGEEGAANVLRVGDRLFMGAHWPRSREMVERLGVKTFALAVSEIAKVDAGLSCMSLRWRAG